LGGVKEINMEQTEEIKSPPYKLYKVNHIWLAAFIGGPLGAGYIIANNYKRFNEKRKHLIAWIISIVATLIIFGSVFLIPPDVHLSNQLIPFIYMCIAYFLMNQLQGAKLSAHATAGGQFFGWARVLLIGVISICITLVVMISALFFRGVLDEAPMSIKTFGTVQNEINYDSSNLTEAEVDNLGEAFTATGVFSEEGKAYAYPKKVGTTYEISFVGGTSEDDVAAALEYFKQLRNDLQVYFPTNHIVINIVIGDLDHVVQRLE